MAVADMQSRDNKTYRSTSYVDFFYSFFYKWFVCKNSIHKILKW